MLKLRHSLHDLIYIYIYSYIYHIQVCVHISTEKQLNLRTLTYAVYTILIQKIQQNRKLAYLEEDAEVVTLLAQFEQRHCPFVIVLRLVHTVRTICDGSINSNTNSSNNVSNSSDPPNQVTPIHQQIVMCESAASGQTTKAMQIEKSKKKFN